MVARLVQELELELELDPAHPRALAASLEARRLPIRLPRQAVVSHHQIL